MNVGTLLGSAFIMLVGFLIIRFRRHVHYWLRLDFDEHFEPPDENQKTSELVCLYMGAIFLGLGFIWFICEFYQPS